MPLRPKPGYLQFSNTLDPNGNYHRALNEWIADAMQDAADRIEGSVNRFERALDSKVAVDLSTPEPSPASLFCLRCNQATPHKIMTAGPSAQCQTCGRVSPLTRGVPVESRPLCDRIGHAWIDTFTHPGVTPYCTRCGLTTHAGR